MVNYDLFNFFTNEPNNLINIKDFFKATIVMKLHNKDKSCYLGSKKTEKKDSLITIREFLNGGSMPIFFSVLLSSFRTTLFIRLRQPHNRKAIHTSGRH